MIELQKFFILDEDIVLGNADDFIPANTHGMLVSYQSDDEFKSVQEFLAYITKLKLKYSVDILSWGVSVWTPLKTDPYYIAVMFNNNKRYLVLINTDTYITLL